MDEPKERLIVKNFSGIQFLELEVSLFTVIIGPQSVGKSLTAKLLYFFQNITQFLEDAVLDEDPPSPQETLSEKFEQFFPFFNHGGRNCTIGYQQGDKIVTIRGGGKSGAWKISLPEEVETAFVAFVEHSSKIPQHNKVKSRLSEYRSNAEFEYHNALDAIFPSSFVGSQFVPAGRSFYAQIRDNMASFLHRASLDVFVTDFGIFIDHIKRRPRRTKIENPSLVRAARLLCDQLLSGKYIRAEGEDYIDVKDGRRLSAAFWSSGQQEAHPLTAILLYFCEDPVAACPLFIEEPEAHLFPNAQRLMTELISLAFHADLPYSRIFITTHSPYILTTINNLLMAGQVYEGASVKVKRTVNNKVPINRALFPGSVGAFYMDQNGCRSIMDAETGLVDADAIDEVSIQINETFETLLNLKYHP